MFQFSIGHNGLKDFEETIAPYRERIADVYFAPPYQPSGRVARGGELSLDYPVNLDAFLKWASKEGVETNLLLNALCSHGDFATDRQIAKVRNAVGFYHDTYGVQSVTVTSPFDADIIRRDFSDVKIHASVNMFVRNPIQAKLVEHLTDMYILDRNVNRDLETIKQIKEETGKQIRLLANEGCVLECMNRVQHFNQISHVALPVGSRYLPSIRDYLNDNATVLKAPIIRPEDLHHYEGLADSMKLATRNQGNDDVETILHAYVSQRYDGNLFDLLESNCMMAYLEYAEKQARGSTAGVPYMDNSAIPQGFFEKVTSCDKLCHECGYCNTTANRAFSLQNASVDVTFGTT